MELEVLHQQMSTLSKSRTVFHSEADFQFALAWQLQASFPRAAVRLERHIAEGIHLDLSFTLDSVTTAFELKYLSRLATFDVAGEQFRLRQQGAHPLRRYDIVSDLVRLEQLVASNAVSEGFVIALTNDSGYWNLGREEVPIDAAFRLHQGQRLTGQRIWSEAASAGTMRNREEALRLTGEYVADWRDYSAIGSNRFRYLMAEVRTSDQRRP